MTIFSAHDLTNKIADFLREARIWDKGSLGA